MSKMQASRELRRAVAHAGEENESALIFRHDSVEAVIPRLEADEVVGMDVVTVCALAFALNNQSKYIEKIVEEFQAELKRKDEDKSLELVSASPSLTKSIRDAL